MFRNTKAFSGFSVNDLPAAKKFYAEILGLEIEEHAMGLTLKIAGGTEIIIYPKPAHTPATYTMLNFPVENIQSAIAELKKKGITLEHYPGLTDSDGIMRGLSKKLGPDIAWFKDPAGNIISVLQDK